MPFTFSHPAIIIPLTRFSKRYVSVTGLIAGSMAPDFEYFMRMAPKSVYSHTLWGLLTFNLPMALLISFIFHLLLRNTLIEHLPEKLFYRFHPYRSFNWLSHLRRYAIPIVSSIIIGAFSHIFWDSFTHNSGYAVRILPFLRSTVGIFPLFRLVQHGSTVLGFIAIGWAIYRIKKTYADPPGKPAVYSYWIKVLFTTVLVSFLFLGVFIQVYHYVPARGIIVVSIINSFLLGLFVATFSSKSFIRKAGL